MLQRCAACCACVLPAPGIGMNDAPNKIICVCVDINTILILIIVIYIYIYYNNYNTDIYYTINI